MSVDGNQVRLGVAAPREVAVHREEIYQRIQIENGEEPTTANPIREPHERDKRRTQPKPISTPNYAPAYSVSVQAIDQTPAVKSHPNIIVKKTRKFKKLKPYLR